MSNDQSVEQNLRNAVEMYKIAIKNFDLGGSGQNMHWALNKGLPQGMALKPWGELNEEQKARLIMHVSDMSSWRGEGRVDPDLADYLLEYNPEFLEMMA